MSTGSLCSLKRVRTLLGKSQSEMSALLGISVRAVQSYEQGWRPCPPYVQKLAGLLLFLKWRKNRRKQTPCWEIQNCPRQARQKCMAWEIRSPELCWLLTGTLCGGKKQKSWQAKLATCSKCKVMKAWAPA